MLRPKKEDLAGESLIYEKANGITYARFRDTPKKNIYPGRWEIGRDHKAPLMDYAEWNHLLDIAETSPTLKIQLDKLLNLYYIIKDEQ